ncbi:MAG: FAD-dependent oxidoreductase [Burkholderiales bacterium]|nr:FAD-dependent oxidoreductase [Burkholderiales bacterium]
MLEHKPGFFEWQKYPFQLPPELSGAEPRRFQVAVVGAGPVGLATALALAQQGIRTVCLEARDQLSDSSRTLAVSRRSVQVLDRLGVAAPFCERAVPRERNYVYQGHQLIHSAPYEQSPTEKHPDISVLQQPWVEKFLLDAVLAHPNVELRWLSAVTGVDVNDPERPRLTVETAQGRYTLDVDYVVAADGARGAVRRELGLPYREIGDGVSSRNFVICDFEMKSALPVSRRLWIRPPHRPNSAVILQRQPYDTWRLDYALDDDEDRDQALKPESVARVVQAQVDLLGDATAVSDWRIVWISSYRPMSRSLDSYRHGRIFFAGDAAHQTPIFGGRGMNQGLLDASNLAWRLGFVLNGHAPQALLDVYDHERRPVIVRNLHAIGQATLCMTAPSRGAALMRKAVFDLLPGERFVIALIDAFNANKAESLLTPPPAQDPAIGAAVGSPLPDAPLLLAGTSEHRFLHDALLRNGLTGIYFCIDGEVPEVLQAAFAELAAGAAPFRPIVVARRPGGHAWACDPTGAGFAKLAAEAGTWLLVRPDGYVGARLEHPHRDAVLRAFNGLLHFDAATV